MYQQIIRTDSDLKFLLNTYESGLYMQSMMEAENSYQGITPDERMALSHAFDNGQEVLTEKEQAFDVSFSRRATE